MSTFTKAVNVVLTESFEAVSAVVEKHWGDPGQADLLYQLATAIKGGSPEQVEAILDRHFYAPGMASLVLELRNAFDKDMGWGEYNPNR